MNDIFSALSQISENAQSIAAALKTTEGTPDVHVLTTALAGAHKAQETLRTVAALIEQSRIKTGGGGYRL